MKVACLLAQETYKPGDLPPEGYLAWHEWAEVQRKAGIKQVPCGKCGLWRTPQELSNEVLELEAKDRRGRTVLQRRPVCSKCAPNALDGQSAQGEKSVPGHLSKRNEG